MDQEIKDFYNNFGGKLIDDFLKPNRRIGSAIEFVLNHLSEKSNNILDIGCGIGWSSFEIQRQNKEREVTAIDLSPELVAIAQELFREFSSNYLVQDLTKGLPGGKTYSSIILLDVYEHIPKSSRNDFHQSLLGCLDDRFEVFLTCPSVKHQTYLREQNPEGLQPVDEDVSVEDLLQLAADLKGEITYFELKNLWSQGDYFHCRIANFHEDAYQKNKRLLHIKEKLQRLNDSKLDYHQAISFRQHLSYLKHYWK